MRNKIILKLTLIIATIFLISKVSGQVGIINKTPNVNSVLDVSKGIDGMVLPWVTILPNSPKLGTIIFDATTASTPNFKYYNGSWNLLSGNGSLDLSVQNSLKTISTGIAIQAGSNSENMTIPKGALDLQSNNKALVLPIVTNPATSIINPTPGMIVFDTNDKMVKMFTGQVWEYYR